MADLIGPITNTVIDTVVNEIKKKHNKERLIKYVIDPLLYNISSRYYSYFIMTIIVLVIFIILLISILILVVVKK